MKTTEKLAIGNWVHCILYGGTDGVIYAIHGEQSPESVRTMGGICQTGGRAEFDIVWENGSESRMIPECIILGVQWHRRPELPNASAAEIATMRAFAASEELRKKAEAKNAADKFTADMEALKTNPKYSHLKKIEAGTYGSCGKLVASNLRIEFKKLFPGTKFSVRKEHFGSIRIEWTDGPTTEEVKKVSNKYSGGYFDSPFTSVFGSCDYIFETRNHSPEALKAAADHVSFEYGWPTLEVKVSSYGSAYLPCDNQDHYRKVYDHIEKRHEYAARPEIDEREERPIEESEKWTNEDASKQVGGTVGTLNDIDIAKKELDAYWKGSIVGQLAHKEVRRAAPEQNANSAVEMVFDLGIQPANA